MTAIRKIELPVPGIEQLAAEARSEGYLFIDKLVREWSTGENRFDAPGEMLCGVIDRGLLVAVGGLTLDPFLNDPATGRIRRIFVRPAWRNQGVGRALVLWLLERAREHFYCVRLRAENPGAARLYERLGFSPIDDPHATHRLAFHSEELRFHVGRGAAPEP